MTLPVLRLGAGLHPAPAHAHYCALPLLWRGRAVGWGNLAVRDARLRAELGYVTGGAPHDAGFPAALQDEVVRMAVLQVRDDT